MASGGYPEHYEKGFAITMPAETAAHTYVAGAKRRGGQCWCTSGGRVLGVTATAAHSAAGLCTTPTPPPERGLSTMLYRHDIGQRALAALED